MDVVATSKYVRISPRKTRDFMQLIRGVPVPQALKIIEFSERKAAIFIGKALKSAIANAENNAKISAEDLRVKEAIVQDGPAFKRFWPRARGMVSRIRKRTSHITITLTDDKAEE